MATEQRVTQLSLALLLVAATSVAASVAPSAPDFTLIAHRGASWDAPEHTFAAWDRALADSATWIEQDLVMTADGVLVVFHDDTLGRTARGPAALCTGRVAERTLADLAQCEVGSWFNAEYPDRARSEYALERIRTLDEVLTRYRNRGRFYIETKRPEESPGMEEALIALLKRHRLAGPGAERGRVTVQSFSAAGLARLRGIDSGLDLVRLLDDPIPRDSLGAVMQEIALYAKGIAPSRRIVTSAMVETAHAAGLYVHVYTVNEPAVLRWVRANNVDGVFTDRPALLRRELRLDP